jgi:tetratricopeptide (TPR) repeat protein
MPQRPRSHQIEAESRRALADALGDRFVFRDERDDYGLDGTVEEFDETGQATGLRFHVQLKATDERDLSRSLAVPIKRETANYYRSLTLPVLMVRYRANDGTLYVRWFHQLDGDEGGMAAETMRFRWQTQGRLDESGPRRLVKEARAFLTLRSPTLKLPLDLYLEVAPAGDFGLGPTVLLFALRNAAARRSDIFSVQNGPVPDGAIRVVAGDDLLSVNLAGVTTATVRVDNYDAGKAGEQFGIDAMVLAALGFEQIGRTDVAGRLTTGFLEESSLVGAPEVAWGLSSALRRSRRVNESLRLADALHASDDPVRREASLPFVLTAKWHGISFESDELELFEEVVERRIERCLDAGDVLEAGHNSYNLANLLRSRCEPEKSLASFDRALRHNSNYSQRSYFHSDRAGMLFHAGRYVEAAEGYAQAHSLDPADPLTIGLRADALMFAGRYADARAGFAEYNAAAGEKGLAEWRLKEQFLGILIEQFDVPSQDRRPEEADRAFKAIDYSASASDVAIKLDEVLQLDPLSGLAWFNLGRAHLDLNDRDAALVDYLGAALCNLTDAEAWLNTVVLAVDRPEGGAIVADALECAARFAGSEFRRQVVQWTQAQSPRFPAEEWLDMIDEYLQERQGEVRNGMLLRHIGRDGQINEMVLGRSEI